MPENTTPKPWYQSRAMWGGVASVAAALGGLIGWQVDAPALTDLLVGAGALAGGVLALWGRAQASRPIRPLRPSAGE